MMEIPESNTLAVQLNERVKGRKITGVCAGKSPHRFTFYFESPELYPLLLEGKTIDETRSIAGQLEIYAGDARIVLSDGVNLRYAAPGSKLPEKHQLLLELEDGSALTCTVQMYGGIHAFLDGENENMYYLLAKEKPSPLTEDFDEAYFENLWSEAKKNMSAKAFLATEQRIPGLGNGVLQDILFLAGVNPKSKLEKLEVEERSRIFHSVKDTLRTMTQLGGRDTEKNLFGAEGGYRSVLSKKTLMEPCPQCGGAITREAYLGGNVYYCAHCQPIKK